MIARLNGIERPELLRVNQKLKILTGPREIFVDKSDFRLALFIGGHFIKQYPVGLGKHSPTPAGTFSVDQTLVKPDWYPPEGGVIRYGEPGHLIGERWIGLEDQPGASGIGIHGTNDPESIGTLCSHGCIRMLNRDVEELYDFVTPGTTVRIVE
jgi:lipoprotein-anchoring transpeptidase ErfK/SrfK